MDSKSNLLFSKKAFFDLNGLCPENHMNVASEIVEKCVDLPLAIVAIYLPKKEIHLEKH
jgi:hypothetical protein